MSLKQWLSKNPRLRRFGWAVRMLAITGPWHSVLLAYCRKFSNNPEIRPTSSTLRLDVDVDQRTADLKQNGWTSEIRLPEEQIDRIVEFTNRSPQNMYDEPHRHCEAVRQIACDPKILEIVRRYVGGEPILYASVIRRSGRINPEHVGDSHVYRFHFDVADVKSLALFVYLTDVDERCGPHVVISGTHHRKSMANTLRLYLDEATAQTRYGERINTILGPRGTAFLEEQTAYHKQLVPLEPRMILRITYTLWRIPGCRRFLPALRRRPVEPLLSS